MLRKAIFAGHVSEYMKSLSQSNPDRYKKQFSRYIKAGISPDKVESIYKNAHKKIRENPQKKENPKKKKKESEEPKDPKDPKAAPAKKPKRYNRKKMTINQRKARVAQKLANKKKAESAK